MKKLLILLALSVLPLLLAPSDVFAAELYVDSDDCSEPTTYCTIQEAIDNSIASFTIEIKNGTYNESIIIDKALTIQSEDPLNKVVINGTETLTTIISNDVTIENIIFTGMDLGNYKATLNVPKGGTYLNYTIDYNNITLSGLEFFEGKYAIYSSVNNLIIEDSIFQDQLSDSIILTSGSGTTTIENNTFSGAPAKRAILFQPGPDEEPPFSGDVTIKDNIVNGKHNFVVYNQYIEPTELVSITIEGNTIATSGTVITMYDPGIEAPNFEKIDSMIIKNNKFTFVDVDQIGVKVPDYSVLDGVVDASENYWESTDFAQVYSRIEGNVSFQPWYIDQNLTILSTANDINLNMTSQIQTISPVDENSFLNPIILVNSTDISPIILKDENSDASLIINSTTTIQGEASWDGIFYPPTIVSSSDTTADGKSPVTVYEVGSPNSVLIIDAGDSPATILLEGITGQVGYKMAGQTEWILITNVCDDYANPTDPAHPFECYISDGTDTKIITWHLTQFGGGFTSPSSSGGSSNGDRNPPQLIEGTISSGILSQSLIDQQDLITFQTGESITIELELYENSGNGIWHLELVTDIRDTDTIYDSDLWIEYNNGRDNIITDENNLWKSIDFTIEDDEDNVFESNASFTMIFDDVMEPSDIIIRAWDLKRNSVDFTFDNVFQVVESGGTSSVSIKDAPIDDKADSEKSTVQKQTPKFSKGAFENWKNIKTSDKEFLDDIGIKGKQIPQWVNNAANWFAEDLISEKEFMAILKNLEKRNILN